MSDLSDLESSLRFFLNKVFTHFILIIRMMMRMRGRISNEVNIFTIRFAPDSEAIQPTIVPVIA